MRIMMGMAWVFIQNHWEEGAVTLLAVSAWNVDLSDINMGLNITTKITTIVLAILIYMHKTKKK